MLDYYNKNLKKHFNFFYNVDTVFHLNSTYFQSDQKKILFMMQYLKKLFKKVWFNYIQELEKAASVLIMLFVIFKKFLLNFMKNLVNKKLHHAQLHQNVWQRFTQSIQAFFFYLKELKTHLLFYIKEQKKSILFTKLKSKLQNVLINYQDLFIVYESFIFLNTHLKRNMNKSKINSLSKKSHSEKDSE